MILRFPFALLFLLTMESLGSARTLEEIRLVVSSISDIPYICRQDLKTASKFDKGCGDSAFWSLVKTKDTIIVDLIELIDDSTMTSAQVPNFGGNYAVGDAALSILQEILWDIHPLKLVGLQQSHTCGNCTYWEYVRSSRKNRLKLETSLKKWYTRKKKWMEWVSGNQFGTCDCRGPHPSDGHFRIEKGK